MYNAELINLAQRGKAKTVKACQDAARLYSVVALPESVYLKVNTRRKLYNFLIAFKLDAKAIMHQFDLSVPSDKTLPKRAAKALPRMQLDESEYIF